MKFIQSKLEIDWTCRNYKKSDWSIKGQEIKHYNKYFGSLENWTILKVNDIRSKTSYNCIKIDTSILWDRFDSYVTIFKSSTANYFEAGGSLDWYFLLHDCIRYGHYYLYGFSTPYNKKLSLKECKRKLEIKYFL